MSAAEYIPIVTSQSQPSELDGTTETHVKQVLDVPGRRVATLSYVDGQLKTVMWQEVRNAGLLSRGHEIDAARAK